MRGFLKLAHTAYLLGPGRRRILSGHEWLKQWKHVGPAQRQQERSRLFVELFRFAFDNVPFYRDLYTRRGITRSDIGSLDDITRLPIVTREALASSPLKTTPPKRVSPLQGRATTSGSSGRPLVVNRSMDCIALQGAQLLRHLDVWGLSERRRVFFCLYNEDPTMAVELPYSSPLSIFNRSHSIDFGMPPDDLYGVLRQVSPDALITYASKAEEICDWALQARIPYEKPIVFGVGAETLTPAVVAKFREAFPAGDIFSVYGSVEMGLIAFECPCHSGLHVNDWSLVLEKGQEYEGADGRTSFSPVYTNLRNRGTPFIRYAGIDDLMTTDDSPCDCGYGPQAIKKLQGRATEMLRSPTTASVPVSAMVSAHADVRGVKRFQYVQKDERRIVFRYVPYADSDHKAISAAASAEFRKLLGNELDVQCEAVARIARRPGSPKTPMLVAE